MRLGDRSRVGLPRSIFVEGVKVSRVPNENDALFINIELFISNFRACANGTTGISMVGKAWGLP